MAVNARSRAKPTDPRIVELRADIQREFADSEFGSDEVMSCLHQAISPVRVVTVNMRGGKLDYEQNKRNGLHVIAIGG